MAVALLPLLGLYFGNRGSAPQLWDANHPDAAPRPQRLDENERGDCAGSWIDKLRFAERKVYSQNQEDGITLSLIEHVKPKNKFFVEFGTEAGNEVNTRVLRGLPDWQGLLLDGSNENPSINLHKTMIKADTIASVFKEHNVPLDLALLSVDIDSYDYWVLTAILDAGYKPDIIITEVNSQLGYTECLTVPPASETGKAFLIPGAVNFGVSVPLYASFAEKHGYTMVYCESLGVNCFYVRTEYVEASLRKSCPVGRKAYVHKSCPAMSASCT